MLYSFKIHQDMNEFLERSEDFLLEHEIENVLFFSILDSLKEDLHTYGEEDPLFISLEKEGKLCLIALQTPPHNLLHSYTEDLDSIDYLAKELLKRDCSFPGVLGFKKGADKFVETWKSEKSLNAEVEMYERCYKLQDVNPETLGEREFKKAELKHAELILNWAEEFLFEAMEAEADKSPESIERIKRHIKTGQIFILKDKEKVVSMVRKAGKTPHGRLINLVYTPPELRGKGYATECVAHLSKLILEEGYEYCALFTDLSNPVSNKIYIRIGYRPIIDFNMYKFY